MGFWDRVEQLRISQNTTYRWIADKIVHKRETTVSGWRSQNVLPRADDAVLIAQALGTTVEELVTGKPAEDLPAEFLANCRVLHEAGLLESVEVLARGLVDKVLASQPARASSAV